MPTRCQIHHAGSPSGRSTVRLAGVLVLVSTVILGFGCSKLREPVPEPFISSTVPPKIQEFRWSNGKLPASLDPARAAAPPETDIVRAVFEGLTETDPRTLDARPGVAESWSANDDLTVWTFKLRNEARWSDGSQVTSHDFVRAWNRLKILGEKAAHRSLLSNIVGMPKIRAADSQMPAAEEPAAQVPGSVVRNPRADQNGVPANGNVSRPDPETTDPEPDGPAATATPTPEMKPDAGFSAVDELTFRVKLVGPDKDFPRLVANPIFRPRHNADIDIEGEGIQRQVRTNGAFRVNEINALGVSLERSETYWNRESVRLERVFFAAMASAEDALAAYRNGELDAITNMRFSLLTLKLLTPYEDFRTTTHSALNFYEVNIAKAPFSDRRVREALSNAIERERLTESDTDGIARPALAFLPFGGSSGEKLTQDKAKARELLEEAGFPNGVGFPTVRLLINRNETQLRVARSVARMWKENLKIETEIITKDLPEVEKARAAGDFDLVRRGVVFPTSGETANFRAIFDTGEFVLEPDERSDDGRAGTPTNPQAGPSTGTTPEAENPGEEAILSEVEAIYELRAIPLYFPTSYSLVKPYVTGFDLNSLDAIMLSNVAIDSNWNPDRN